MKTFRPVLLATVYVISIFALTGLWEFYLEDLILPALWDDHAPEPFAEHLEYMLTSGALAIVALLGPAVLALRSMRERRQAEQTQQRLVSILQATPDKVFIYNRNARLIFANRAGRELLGLAPQDALDGVDFRAFLAAGEVERFYHSVLGAVIRDGVWMGEMDLISGQGEPTPVSAVIIAHMDEAGQLQYVSSVARDIVEQKELERIKSDFVTIVSHELRTPLTSIRSALSLVTGEISLDLPSDAREMLRIAETNTDRLIRLVNDILDLEKIQYQKFDLNIRHLDARALVKNAVAELGPMARQAHIGLSYDVPAGLELEGDRDRLSQVITNLLGNAIKFSEAGGAVEVRVARNGDGQVRFAVRDHGPGIHWEHFPKLFGKFQQLGAPKNLVKHGAGLGLAISKAIVEQHGGEIGVESEIGQGSEFFFVLPLHQPPDEAAGH
ncbi:MAG: PAS domain S-box protein [Candidatus Lambdaproteobacteria bacterium]|nr:PAS domain S-box protein [Candidatus Lambdaproteobacteria bacterium]